MQWFKHYYNAKKAPFNRELIRDMKVEGYGYYMLLLGVLCEKFNGNDEKISVHVDDLLEGLEIKQRKKLDDFLKKLNQVSTKTLVEVGRVSVNFLEKSGNFYFFEAPILFDLKDRDFKKATLDRASSAPKNKSKEKRIKTKNIYGIHEKLDHEILKPHFVKVKRETQEAWISAYPDHVWLKEQLLKAVMWLVNNDEKRKDMGRYLGGWLSRSRTPKNTYQPKRSTAEIAQEQIANNPFRNEVSA